MMLLFETVVQRHEGIIVRLLLLNALEGCIVFSSFLVQIVKQSRLLISMCR